jgi:hypothetical protein
VTARASVFHDEYRRKYTPIDYQLPIASGVDPAAAAVIASKTGHSIVLTRITFNCITDSAKTLIVRDDASTPLVATVFPASPGVGTRFVSYEPQGMEMTFEKNVDISGTGAGLAGTLLIEGYYLPLGPRVAL